jgi:hypothetical protein
MVIELLDGLAFSPVDTRPQVFDLIADLVTARF